MSTRGFPITKARRAERRAAAEKRQAEYDKLTLEQQLEKLPPEPAAKKVRAKLLLKLQKRDEAAQQAAQATAAKQAAAIEKKSQKKNK